MTSPSRRILPRRQRLNGLDQLGHGMGDVIAAARVDADIAAVLVHLDACAVELELQRGLAEPLQGLGDVARRLGQHRLEGTEEAEMEVVEPGPPFGEHGLRHGGQLAGQHEGAAHLVGRHLGRRGERFGHEPGESSLAQLAEDEAHEEALLLRRGAGEQAPQEARPLRGRARPGHRSDALERGIDLADSQRRLGRGAPRQRVAHRRAAQADPPLAEEPGEPGDGGIDLIRSQPPQQVGEGGGLRGAGAGLGDAAGGGDEVGEAHRRDGSACYPCPAMPSRARPAAILAALAPLLLAQAPADLPPITRDLGSFGFPPTTGAAPGYIADSACALCHSDLAESYAPKGMARAFQRPRPASDIEDFSAPPFVHAPSGQQLQMMRSDGRLVFRRWQTGPDGQPINVFEVPVDWILGSGDHARTYLYRTAGGELYQLPLAWYTQTGRWGMAPGFDRADHEGVLRRVRRECVFCHTAYPDVPTGGDAHGAPQIFPAEMPEGIGCQRCHGPGAEHVGLALGGIGLREEIRASIFNPGRLPVARRDEVCQGCHLQPSVAIPGLRRFGRGDFSFRPGEPLAGYLVQVDVEEEGKPRSERFEINHHPYRLQQSRCFLASAGSLSCLTCHDPHRRVAEEERAAHYRAACERCHRQDACTRPEHSSGGTDPGDCASCHMPKRRTQDVVHVVMTDHKITRTPGGPALLAPLSESEPVLVDVRLLPGAPGGGTLVGALGEVYRAAAVARTAGGGEAIVYLEKKLNETRPAEIEPWLDLAQAQIQAVRPADAERTLTGILERHPGHPQALEWLALAQAGQGRLGEAIALLRQLLAKHENRIEAEYNLGRLLAAQGKGDEAALHLENALKARPNLAAGWHYLGEIRAAQGRTDEALACWRRALEIDPRATKSYLSLGRTLLARGERAEALRWLRHGAKAAARPEAVAAELATVEGEAKTHGRLQ